MFKGHNRQGYAVLTETEATDGTVSESVGAGVLTRHTVDFSGVLGSSTSEHWAGDSIEDSESDTTGTIKITLSQLSLEDEAALGGHEYDAETHTMREQDGDTAPYVRYAAIGVGRRKDATTKKMKDFYRVAKYYKVKFGTIDDDFKTREKSVTYKDHAASGTCYKNCEGKRRDKQDCDTFEEALAAMKTFLNVT